MKIRLLTFSTTLITLLAMTSGLSCGTEVSGDEVRYGVSAEGVVSQGSPERFTNARGWEIDLTRAQALVGPIYFYSGEARASLLDRLLGPNQAYACAAHAQFQSGRTLGETPLQFGVDLLAGTTLLFDDGIAETGEVQSVELHVQNPGQVEAGNELAAASPEATYEFEGTARKDGVEVPFSASITLPEDGTHQIIDSIPARMELSEDATLHLEIQVDRLFRDVDFASLTSDEETEGASPIEPGTQAYTSLVFSLRSRSAFVWKETP